MDNIGGKIETFGNRCFVGRPYICVREDILRSEKIFQKEIRPKPEKVFFRFGKVRVQVTSAKRVRVTEEGESLVIILNES